MFNSKCLIMARFRTKRLQIHVTNYGSGYDFSFRWIQILDPDNVTLGSRTWSILDPDPHENLCGSKKLISQIIITDSDTKINTY